MGNKSKRIIKQYKREVTVVLPLDFAETLYALLDSRISTSGDGVFIEQMSSVRDRLECEINKHYE